MTGFVKTFGTWGHDNIIGDDRYGDDRPDYVRGECDDCIFGDKGNDRLYGQGGCDYLHGDQGDDGLAGGKDNDFLYGGSGADSFAFRLGDCFDYIDDMGAHDRIQFVWGNGEAGLCRHAKAASVASDTRRRAASGGRRCRHWPAVGCPGRQSGIRRFTNTAFPCCPASASPIRPRMCRPGRRSSRRTAGIAEFRIYLPKLQEEQRHANT